MYDRFKNYHPLVNFLYFTLVLTFSMAMEDPISQAISFLAAITYSIQVEGRKATLFTLKFSLPMLLLTAFVNPAFTHQGVTLLAYLPSGNPLTLESILYGFSAGCMLVTLLTWFLSFNRVITSDKFIYLFGRVIPAMSLVLSMALRFVPKFQSQMHQVTDSQRSIGRDPSEGSLWQRTKNSVVILSIMVTWALENAIETADSMKSRGYGLPDRSAFSIYRFDERDQYMMAWLLFSGAYVGLGCIAGAFQFRYYPMLWSPGITPVTVSMYCVFLAMCASPIILNAIEERKWKAIYSNM